MNKNRTFSLLVRDGSRHDSIAPAISWLLVIDHIFDLTMKQAQDWERETVRTSKSIDGRAGSRHGFAPD